ncbi:histidine phosphatase family protein [Arenibaculum sp.]|uniref:histidine phosphatase family protein n=1 Tax=Arenibaculum sp. TaxID=2865862 RepID=UPI002E14DF0A|nr:histidine phosphatase family protein [Arenibaculum sp.]
MTSAARPDIPLFGGPFHFLRHGETVANRAGTIAGHLDSPLTELGRRQARDAGSALAGAGIRRIWTSSLSRAHETAAIVAEPLGVEVTVLAGLRERAWGAWEGQPRAVLVRSATPEGGEGPDAFRGRVLAALAETAGPWPALIVAHSGVYRVLHETLLGVPAGPSVPNGVPMRFVPADDLGAWRMEPTGR